MRGTYTKLLAVLLATWLASVDPGAVFGQATRSLAIRDGKVFVNGRELPAGEIPATLPIGSLEGQWSFVGESDPIIVLGERAYQIDGEMLQEVDVPEFGSAPYGFTFVREPGTRFVWRNGPVVRDPVAERRLQELNSLTDQFQLEAEMRQEFVREMPRIELQRYLQAVERVDQPLHRRLVRELQLEQQSLTRAHKIRETSDEAQRNALRVRLRQDLEEIFDLKQENRRMEIQKLEERLEELRTRLEERESLRQAIIDKRIEELTDSAEESF